MWCLLADNTYGIMVLLPLLRLLLLPQYCPLYCSEKSDHALRTQKHCYTSPNYTLLPQLHCLATAAHLISDWNTLM
jgi:hypothetical protein